MPTFDIKDAKSQFSEMIQAVKDGKQVVIIEDGKPIVSLVAIPPPSLPLRGLGSMRGKIWIADDFDGPLPADIQAAFEGK